MRPGLINKYEGVGFPSLSRAIACTAKRRMDVKGYYSVLGINPDASEKEIRAVARQRFKETHPDGAAPNREEFEQIQEAYDTLMYHRDEYDALEEKDVQPVLSKEEEQVFNRFVAEEGDEVVNRMFSAVEKQLSSWSFYAVGNPYRYVDLAQDWYDMALPVLSDLGYEGNLKVCVVPGLDAVQFDFLVLGVPVMEPSMRKLMEAIL